MSHRLFVALRPPRAFREALDAIMDGIAGARWQDDDQLHVTLRFIGTVDRHQAEDIAAALGGIHAPALDLAAAGLGRFDWRGRIDSLWAGIAPADRVTALHRKIDAALIRTGLPPEGRAYLPHVTLARFGRGAGPVEDFIARHGALAIPAMRFDAFCLYESHLGPGGASYEIVARYPLD